MLLGCFKTHTWWIEEKTGSYTSIDPKDAPDFVYFDLMWLEIFDAHFDPHSNTVRVNDVLKFILQIKPEEHTSHENLGCDRQFIRVFGSSYNVQF